MHPIYQCKSGTAVSGTAVLKKFHHGFDPRPSVLIPTRKGDFCGIVRLLEVA